LLAGIGHVESGQANNGALDATGRALTPIIGPALNGTGGFALIRDTDHGVFDGDKVYDHAVGPMQFLPSTWRLVGRDANGDGKADPENINDAALGAAVYLCDGGGDLGTRAGLLGAVYRYNQSWQYVSLVLTWAGIYAGAFPTTVPVAPVPKPTTPRPTVPAPTVPAPTVPAPTVPAPKVPVPSVPAPRVPAPTVPAPKTPDPTTPDPSSPEPKPAPATPAPTEPPPATPPSGDTGTAAPPGSGGPTKAAPSTSPPTDPAGPAASPTDPGLLKIVPTPLPTVDPAGVPVIVPTVTLTTTNVAAP
jgi:hypothetical protein